ncbi:hypothetical protein F442_20558, partial [Phytophthora nicotianae P10297]
MAILERNHQSHADWESRADRFALDTFYRMLRTMRQWATTMFSVTHRKDTEWDYSVVWHAIKGNHFALAQWLFERVIPSNPSFNRWAAFAARNGNLDMIKWISSLSEEIDLHGAINEANGPSYRRIDLDRACLNGHIAVVEWVICHHPKLAHIRHADYDAAKKGRLDIVKLLHSNNIDGCTRIAIQIAAARGHLDVVKWMLLCKHKKLAGIRTRRTMDCAAESGDLEMVKWLHKNTRKTCSTPAMDRAASSGHLDVVQYLHENRSEGCSTSAMDDAARNGNLQIVQWLSENRTEGCTTHAMDYAAAGGHIEVVKWLHDNRHEGCTINAMNYAAKNGHLDVVKCLHLNRTEGCTTEAMDGAAGSCYLDVVLWLSENRSESCTTLTLDHAARNGYQNMVEWLLRNSSEGGTAATMASIAARGNIEEVYWCHFVARVPYDASAIDAAVLNSRFAVAWFLHDHRESNGCDI